MGQLGSITCREVEPHIVRFRDPMDFQCHLVIGSERALLVDAMGGHGDLRAAVSQVTDLPVTVVATHSHYDHWTGAYFFDVVWMEASEIERIPLEKELAAGRVAVVTGFQGIGPNGDVTALGRGGSDTSAVALAVWLHAASDAHRTRMAAALIAASAVSGAAGEAAGQG